MEYWVYGVETVWELKGDGVSTRSHNDLVWSKELVRELLGRPGCTEELGLDECLGTNFEIWSWSLSRIGRSLVSSLGFGYVLPEFMVELVEIGDKIACMCGGKVTLGVNSEVWVITLIGKEGHNAGSGSWS